MRAKIRRLLAEVPEEPEEHCQRAAEGVFKQALVACIGCSEANGYVYFVQWGEFVKIGYTGSSVQSRIDTFKTGCPQDDYTLLAVVRGNQKLETKLHRIFKEFKRHREWFRFEGELARFIHVMDHRRPSNKESKVSPYQDSMDEFEKISQRMYPELEIAA